MTYDDLQELQIGDYVWYVEHDGPLGPPTGRKLRATVVGFSTYTHPATKRVGFKGRVTVQTEDGKKHDVLASLVEHMNVLDRLAEASK